MNSRIYEYLLAIEEEQNISRASARCLLPSQHFPNS